MARAMSLKAVVSILERQEQELHYLLSFAPLPEKLHKRMKDHQKQKIQFQDEIRKYDERMNGVVRAKGPNF
ncbi:hypothetical protein [Corynebacterium stationis]|uniref:hypothetical protein n=1 Tax=Corynebacterium stationis TaxID=1705 RepID=UPI0028B06F87|nr:hypothetical protein [Corynebacterium stationis]